MISLITLKNFRGFEKHQFPINPVTLAVGKNNAGKSTLVEALRLVAIVAARHQNLPYKQSPNWTGLPKRNYGVSPSLKNFEIDFENIFHRYGEPPALIQAEFSNGSSITIYIFDHNRVFAIIKDENGKIVRSKSEAIKAEIPTVSIMPQVAPVQKKETTLNEDYVKRTSGSSLAPLHFRNQIKVFKDSFSEFKSVVEATWPGVQVTELIGSSTQHGGDLFLEVRNEDFVAEVASMGHGLQMWLQTMWFLTRSNYIDTVILDEPDVYMHADLQRRLIRFIRGRFPQVIVTTHSIEMMSEAEPEEILIIDRRSSISRFADSLPAVQTLFEHVGTVQNIHLARLWNSRRFLFVEGKDVKLLKEFQNTIYPDSDSPIDMVPNMSLGGWGGWNYAIGSAMTLENSLGEAITAFCLLDSDYHTDITIEKRKNQAKIKGISLHIWSRKEIENYLLIPEAIKRHITKNVGKRTTPPTVEEVETKMDELAELLEEEAFDGFATEILAENRSLGSGGANKEARRIIKERKGYTFGLKGLVSGKALLSQLSNWSKGEFGVSFNAVAIAREARPNELDEEVTAFVRAVEEGQSKA